VPRTRRRWPEVCRDQRRVVGWQRALAGPVRRRDLGGSLLQPARLDRHLPVLPDGQGSLTGSALKTTGGARSGALIGCYCGSTPPSTCVTVGPASGPCVSQETNGLDTTTPGSVNKAYSNTSLPAGMANVAFNCAIANGCARCLE
jgi:hypothetical protein